ncbi:MAG: pyruvate kinase, partial [Deltaproteobacteria bacterium]|nr:pyruvate kinase [Deltaproteobacteria bacterium]
KYIARMNPEYVAVSFVGDHDDVVTIRNTIAAYGNQEIKLIAKIERPQAVTNFDSILEHADGIMVARGDLGVELPAEDVPPAQKQMIKKCNRYGKVVIVATQMLESMVKAPTPTRAEVSDVYNAIEDGADAVMLSAETASGEFPFEAVSYMSRIVKRSEEMIPQRNPDEYDSEEKSISELIGHMVFSVIKELKGAERHKAKIICLTKSGFSAEMISKYRPPLPILAVTSNLRTARELRLVWGIRPILIPKFEGSNESLTKIKKTVEVCYENKLIHLNDKLILVGNFFNIPAQTNMVTLFNAKDVLSLNI